MQGIRSAFYLRPASTVVVSDEPTPPSGLLFLTVEGDLLLIEGVYVVIDPEDYGG